MSDPERLVFPLEIRLIYCLDRFAPWLTNWLFLQSPNQSRKDVDFQYAAKPLCNVRGSVAPAIGFLLVDVIDAPNLVARAANGCCQPRASTCSTGHGLEYGP